MKLLLDQTDERGLSRKIRGDATSSAASMYYALPTPPISWKPDCRHTGCNATWVPGHQIDPALSALGSE